MQSTNNSNFNTSSRNNNSNRFTNNIRGRKSRYRTNLAKNNLNIRRRYQRTYYNNNMVNNRNPQVNQRNAISNYVNTQQYRSLARKIREITNLVKATSLSGAPKMGVNSEQRKNTNNPNIAKEIRYDRLYNAMQMYKMGKYYSFYKTPNMIVRIAIYSCYQFTLDPDVTSGFMWFPYFFPYISIDYKVDTSSLNRSANIACNFITYTGNSQLYHPGSTVDTVGNYRLVSASLKISNTTTNSQKGGCFTIYRVCRNEGQPVLACDTVDINYNDRVCAFNTELMATRYDNEPTKYLYTANQVALINEYGVIDGNTIFQQCHEYMGMQTSRNTTDSVLPVGGVPDNFNPQGVNVKYIGRFDPVTLKQSYTAQAFSIFEFTPVSTSVMATMAFKGAQSVTPYVLQQAKNAFNLQVIKD